MKRYRWFIVTALLIVSWLATEYLMHRRVVPPESVKSLQSFLAWQPSADQFEVIHADGGQHLIAWGHGGAILPSGPSAYVFDDSDRLVDWSSDIGDNPQFVEHWRVQHSCGNDHKLSRKEAANWPTTRPTQ